MTVALRGVKDAYHRMQVELLGAALICDPSGALFLPDYAALVVSDLHLEKGSSFARRGQLLPPYDTAATLDMLARIIERYQPKTVISLGDGFHDVRASERLPALYAIKLKSMMERRDWVWITGNHDPERPANLPGESVEELALGPLIFRHEPKRAGGRDGGRGEIAGHLHPAARIVKYGQSVRRPCFVSDGQRLIMPAFGAYTGALNILDRAFHGLFAEATLRAYMLGAKRVYSIARGALRHG